MKVAVDHEKRLTPPAVARRYGVAPETVVGWIRAGELAAINVAAPGTIRPRFRVSPSALEAFERRRSATPSPKQPRRRRRVPDGTRSYFRHNYEGA